MTALLTSAFLAGWAGFDAAASALLFGGLLAACGVVFLRRKGLRDAALAATAVLLPFAGVEAVFTAIRPVPANAGVRVVYEPARPQIPDALLGYRLPPGGETRARASKGGRAVYDVVYTIDGTGARATPGSRTDTDTFLFLGDSFVFGEGIADGQTLPTLFAAESANRFNVVNLGVPGYGPGGVLRALEAGATDAHVVGRVRAVFVVVMASHLDRVTGDATWLADTPRYDRGTDGGLRHTGTFRAARRAAPLTAALKVIERRLDSAAALATALRRDHQLALIESMLGRMRRVVDERYGAELVVVHWSDRGLDPDGLSRAGQLAKAIRSTGAPVVSVDELFPGFDKHLFNVPDDGHPNERANRLIAKALYHRFVDP